MRISLVLAAVVAAALFVKPAHAAIYKSESQAAGGFTYEGGTITTVDGFFGPVTDTLFLVAWSLSFSDDSTTYTFDETNSTASYSDAAGNNLLVTTTTIEWPQPVGPIFEDRLLFEMGDVGILFQGGDTSFPTTNIFLNTGINAASTGFRPIVATLVPEPTSALFLCASGALACLRRRRRYSLRTLAANHQPAIFLRPMLRPVCRR